MRVIKFKNASTSIQELGEQHYVIDFGTWRLFPVELDPVHGYTMTTEDVADGFDVQPAEIEKLKTHLTAGEHYLIRAAGAGEGEDSTFWTKLGVVTLGLFLEGAEPKYFAIQASCELFSKHPDDQYEEFIVPDDFTCRGELTILLNEQRLIGELLKGSSGLFRDAIRGHLRDAEKCLRESIKPLKRKVELLEKLLDGDKTYSLPFVHQALNLPIEPKNLVRELRERGYLIISGARSVRPSPAWIQQNIFTNARTDFVTARGLFHIWDEFRKNPVSRELA